MVDFESLKKTLLEVEKLYSEIEKMANERDIKSILKKDGTFHEFSNRLQGFNYLEHLSEDFIFEEFNDALYLDSTNPFTDFTQPQRDMYVRLRLRALNQKLTAS